MAYIPTRKSDFDARLAPLLPDYSHAPPDARIIELLQTNAPPTPIEKKSLEATLSETPDRVAELDSLILSTTSLLRYLTKDRSQAIENQANAKKILSPSRRLPLGVLTEIFIRCSSLYGQRDSPLDPRALPWTLSHVCRKWRMLAITTPELWSSIRLNFRLDKFLNGSRIREAAFMLGIVLDRARPHDLDVVICLQDDVCTHPACAVLLSTVRYWKSLYVTGQSCDLCFLSPCRSFFDQLETAVVRVHHHEGSEAIDWFAVAPRLRSFTRSMNAPFLLPVNVVQFIDDLPFDANTRATLHNLVNIERLSISCSSYSSELPRIHLPRLSQLELEVDLRCLEAAFITYNHFDFPSLSHLQMSLILSHTKIPRQVLQPISSSTVSSLILTWINHLSQKYSASDIVLDFSSLCMLPNLQCLTVEYCPNINPFLGALCILPGKNVMFPKMSTLDVKCEPDYALTEDPLCSHYTLSKDPLNMHILVELLQSRRDQGALRKFKIIWQEGVVNDDVDIRSRWQQLSSPGGGIQISALIAGI
ncbi:hypothetical protein IW262DRAFT_1443535 [Armillaria fumosa]|nr:hypothetical protein IW262DRAFT_1443535 [Armillaria fumosa]